MSRREEAVYLTKSTGILPAMKLKQPTDMLPYAQAMYDGGARVIEITMTTPGVLENFRAISAAFGDKLYLAAGTCLDAASALDAIKAGARILVSPAVVPEVIDIANRYRVACYSGAFTATEVFTVMRAGADMVKIFPAALGGPSYMTNLKMVYPEVNLIPSGGISLETAGEFIRAGACAVSGMRNFFDAEQVAQHGVGWITTQTQRYLQLVANAKKANISLP
ncbi:MAG: bifunctional 4-hydroxy-2-oxoglutarate aldolase/2-dehydro-3-deoxy-phosphogluconate aldolase [Anaerolineae bacterium]|nr:bifunctional 4-hydroxy-2-oxoglutarate aldolase/2-dehydro-3-deoxy-phosphogluconate aldolase [Anaerolineae bacterium]